MIKAINSIGTISEFREKVWELMPKHKNGWREIKEGAKEPVNIPIEIKEFQAKKNIADIAEEINDVVETPTKGDEHATMEIMKEYLESKEIKYHPNIGYDKLKAKYDASKK